MHLKILILKTLFIHLFLYMTKNNKQGNLSLSCIQTPAQLDEWLLICGLENSGNSGTWKLVKKPSS